MHQSICMIETRNIDRYRSSPHALIGCILAIMFALPVSAAETSGTTMTLAIGDATRLSKSPELQVYRFREIGCRDWRKTANLSPQFDLSAEAENIAGTGDLNGVDEAEFTLALSSVIELGGNEMPG